MITVPQTESNPSLVRGSIRGSRLFPALWLFIAMVSAFDAALTVKFQQELPHAEMNPMARFLLDLDEWNPGVFIGFKFLGTTLVLGFLTLAHGKNRPLAQLLASVIAMFQLGLLLFLTL